MAKKKSKSKSDDVAITGDYGENLKEMTDSVKDTGFSSLGIQETIEAPPLQGYFVLKGENTLMLELHVNEALQKGFTCAGGILTYYDDTLGRRYFLQAVVRIDTSEIEKRIHDRIAANEWEKRVYGK